MAMASYSAYSIATAQSHEVPKPQSEVVPAPVSSNLSGVDDLPHPPPPEDWQVGGKYPIMQPAIVCTSFEGRWVQGTQPPSSGASAIEVLEGFSPTYPKAGGLFFLIQKNPLLFQKSHCKKASEGAGFFLKTLIFLGF